MLEGNEIFLRFGEQPKHLRVDEELEAELEYQRNIAAQMNRRLK